MWACVGATSALFVDCFSSMRVHIHAVAVAAYNIAHAFMNTKWKMQNCVCARGLRKVVGTRTKTPPREHTSRHAHFRIYVRILFGNMVGGSQPVYIVCAKCEAIIMNADLISVLWSGEVNSPSQQAV